MGNQARVDILLGLKSRIEGTEDVLGKLAKLQGLLFALGASAPVLAVKGAGELASQIKSIAAQSGISTTALQVLEGQMAADSVQVETLNQSLITLRRNLQDAKADANSPLNQALRSLRLDATGLQAIKPEEQLEVIGRRLSEAEDKNSAFNAALDLLGAKHAPKILESLKRLGSEGYESWARLQKSLQLTPEQLETLDKAGNALERMGRASKLSGANAVLFGLKALDNAFAGPEARDPAKQMQTIRDRIASFEAHGRGDDPRVADYRRSLAAMERTSVTAEDPMHGRAFTPESVATAMRQRANEDAMSAAALSTLLKEIDTSAQKRNVTAAQRSGSMLEDIQKKVGAAMAQRETELDTLAEKFRDLGDSAAPYKKQLEQIVALQGMGKLTADEAAAATARLTREMNREVETMLEKSNDALRLFGADRAALESNPFLTNREKSGERVRLLRAENAELEKTIENLRRLSELPGSDRGQLTGQIRGLRDRQSGNDRAIGDEHGRNLGGAGENVRAELTRLQNEFGTVGENIGSTFGGAIRAGMGAAQEQLQQLIGGTDYWSQRLGVIGGPIMGAITSGISKMFLEWVAGRAIAAAKEIFFSEAEATAKAPGAILTSISSYGTAAIVGVAAVMAALAAAGKFADGGIARGPGGPRDDRVLTWLSNGEGILNARTTSLLGESTVHALNASDNPLSTLGAAAGAGGGGSAKETRHIWVDYRDRGGLARLKSDPRFVNIVHDITDGREV